MANDSDSMLTFYKDHAVAPVRQNTRDLHAHFERRRVLYHQLGIPASGFTGRRVMEVGPGTGQNALFIAAQSPCELVLVEPNPTGREAIVETFDSFPEWRAKLSVHSVPIERYSDSQQFDYVLCEGLVGASGLPDPRSLILAIASQVRPGGVLVLTVIDYVAYLSEMLRRLLGIEIAGHLKNIEQKTATLLPVFSPHLRSLPGSSRRPDDWIIDNLINPASVGRLFSFADCVEFLSSEYDVLATSPRFVSDWAWYKAAALEEDFFNRTALESYWRNLHNFIDCRFQYPQRVAAANYALASMCQKLHELIREYEQTGSSQTRDRILRDVNLFRYELLPLMPATSTAVSEVCSWLMASAVDCEAVAQSKEFGSWWGRGQIYLSMIRRVQ